MSPDASLAIDLHDVQKTYRGKVHALRGVAMQVARGEVFGLIGPNGAGKSTLVKIMMTVIRPRRVTGTMLGAPIGHKATLGRVGYLPEHHRMPEYLTGGQVLDYFGRLSGTSRSDRRERAGRMLDLVGMTEWRDKRIGSYSKGMMQRIGIAQALINDPDLIVLDEPTDGVDPVGRRDIRDMLQQLKDENRTVFLNSHLLSELEMVCDRVAILVKGQVAKQGTIDELTAESRSYEIEIAGAAPEWAAGDEHVSVVTGSAVRPEHSVLRIGTTEASAIQSTLDRLRREERVITAVTPRRDSLEDLFMSAVVDPATGAAMPPGAGGQS